MQIGFAAKIARKMHVASEKRTARRVGLNEGDQKITMFLAETKLDWAISPFQPRISLMRNARPCGGALHKAALLDCGGSTPSGSRDTAPIKWRYPPHLDTPSLKPEERSTLSCPMFERT